MVMDSKNLSNKNIVQIDGGGEGFLGRDNAFTGGNDAKMVQNGASDFGLSGGSAYNWKINGGVGDNVRDDGWNGREVFGGGSEEVARGTDWVGQKNEKTPQFFGTLNDTKTVQAWNNGVVKNTETEVEVVDLFENRGEMGRSGLMNLREKVIKKHQNSDNPRAMFDEIANLKQQILAKRGEK